MQYNNFITLADGARLSYARYGTPGGKPAFYFHGLPGSRREGELLHTACVQQQIDLIAPERDGYGLSHFANGNRLAFWPTAISQLADQLSFEKFYVFAASGGGPYALAVASTLSERVIGTGIGCCLGPVSESPLLNSMSQFARTAFNMSLQWPRLLCLLYGVPVRMAVRCCPARAVDVLGRINGPPDQTILRRSDIRRILAANLREALGNGSRGALADAIAARSPWPFTLNTIQRLHLWHGTSDHIVPLSHSQWLADNIPGSQLDVIENEGHFSLAIGYVDTIIKTVCERYPVNV